MAETRRGAVRIAQVWGINVFVHWSWLVVAVISITIRRETYKSPIWIVIEYLSLFAIVLVHEFGHSLACRQVGGVANQIMLWPLGGVAFVSPPPRPGATLWTIAAGPLVNVALAPVTFAGAYAALHSALPGADLRHYAVSVAQINIVLLVFNMLPIYPLDGGQILQSILWFIVGRVWSLKIVSVLGMVVGVVLAALCLYARLAWLTLMSVFVVWRSFAGWQQAQALSRMLDAPRHAEYACPSCGASPPSGEYWLCGKCHTRFDTFAERGICPGCGGNFKDTQCPACHARHSIDRWLLAPIIEADPV
ncbi:MAG TPA: site-2 protease family protein [Pirellulales bacterium]|nr:site-2 protease family protein [Pirellulales bacterium]